jgi:DNA-binding NtrC family response regulator
MPARKRILIVEDDERTRDMIASFLGEDGFECSTASDGEVALKMLAESAFDVVLSDIRMPNLDGIGLVQRAREIDPALPVVLVTGESVFDTAVLAVQHGAFDYIVKPFSLQELQSAVTRALERRAELTAVAPAADAQGIAGQPTDESTRLRAAAEDLRQTVNAAIDRFLTELP